MGGEQTGLALKGEGVSVQFGGLKALSDVSVSVRPGQIIGLIGPNGAGKTTFVNVLTGFQDAHAGDVVLDGESLAGLPAHAVRRKGIARTFQAGRLFGEMSVRDNVAAAAIGLGMSRRAADREAAALLDWIGVGHLAGRAAKALSYTDQRRVSVARAIIGSPKYLLLDEPAAGMSENESDELSTLVRRIAADFGSGILLIEHNISLVLELCSSIVVLDGGEVIEAGDRAKIRNSAAVRAAYIGSSVPGEDSISTERLG